MAKIKGNISKVLLNNLREIIPNPVSELNFTNTFELLVAVMLSAQCTDKRVNIVTKDLFEKYKSPKDYACLEYSQLEDMIKSCNYYKNKAKNIIETSKILVEKYNSKVPSDHNELVSLPGVGNKTANVIEAVGFKKQAFAVDTHILRVANRLGLVVTDNPTKCEEKLKEIFKDIDFCEMHHLMLLFGRYHCTARNPKCLECRFKELCKYINN